MFPWTTSQYFFDNSSSWQPQPAPMEIGYVSGTTRNDVYGQHCQSGPQSDLGFTGHNGLSLHKNYSGQKSYDGHMTSNSLFGDDNNQSGQRSCGYIGTRSYGQFANTNFKGANTSYQEQPLVAMTTIQPRNTSEWQLYRVLQRANLLQYYETFIAQGGDDVQQLCEAGEEEFLEIMALVGMASKPLHVRRLQKALQEWVANPGGFSGSAQPSLQNVGTSLQSTSPIPTTSSSLSTVLPVVTQRPDASAFTVHSPVPSTPWRPEMSTPQRTASPGLTAGNSSGSTMMEDVKDSMAGMEKRNSTSPTITPILIENQISAIAEAATKLAKELPPFDPKKLNMKKPINKEIANVMQMTDDDPGRLDLLRKYAAIYGRFDSKRKSEKPMSMHEISVNEAAAQLCRHMPTLLTRREDLFPLARQVVRDSGYQYSKGHSRANPSTIGLSSCTKRPRLDMGFIQMYMNLCESNPSMMKNMVDSDRMATLSQELTQATQKQEDIKQQIQMAKDSNQEELLQSLQTELDQTTSRQLQLYTEQSELIRKSRRVGAGAFEDDGLDMPSGNSSPSSRDGDEFNQQVRQHLYNTLEGNKSSQHIQNTLFDEGLRIAQQYGMADFAEELKGLQDDDEDEKPSVEDDKSQHSTDINGKNVNVVNSQETEGLTSNGICESEVKCEPPDSVEVNGS